MEFILYVITVGVIAILYILAYRKLDRKIGSVGRKVGNHHVIIFESIDDLQTAIRSLGKETQEIKTRLAWVKKRQLGKAKNS